MRKKPQKGNPHQLTVKQHCFPARSIERFVGGDGVVNVRLIDQGKSILLSPGDQVFCARWIWDQQAEEGFMREVEGAFQPVANDIERGRVVRRLRTDENSAVTEMFALWQVRSAWREAPVQDQRIRNAVSVAAELSIDEREQLEKLGVASIRPDLTIDGRHIASGVMRIRFFEARKALDGVEWGLLKTRDGEFLVPDVPAGLFLPVTPELCLVPGRGYRIARASDVDRLNAEAVRRSRRYFFARSPVGPGGLVDAE